MQQADFARWALMPGWTLEEAAALAAGLAPERCTAVTVSEADRPPPDSASDAAYQWNLRLLMRSVSGGQIPTTIRASANPRLITVPPSLFLEWARGRIKVPEALVRSVASAVGQNVVNYETLSRDLADTRQECFELRARVGELEAALESGHLSLRQVSDKPLDARERATVLRILCALSVMAHLPERGAVAAVEAQLQQLGFDGPTETTLRRWLADARNVE